jgi:integrase
MTALVPLQPGTAPAAYDPATLAVLAAMEQAAEEHLDAIRPESTKRGYANDWALWAEFHGWLADRTGHQLPLTAVTKGTLVGFVVWLDTVKLAAPNSIDRRITGVTVTARAQGVEVPKQATEAARQALKPMKADPERLARGRGKAAAVTPEQLQRMHAAAPASLAGIRDRALWLMAFGIAGRSAEVAALRADGITHVSQGLDVHVPSVKGRPSRDVVVAYGRNPDTCPVRAWLTWRAAAGITAGPAFVPISVHGVLGTEALSAAGCREIIARSAERAGIAVRLTGHSMRSGFITTARKAGKREEKIRAQSGHAANSPVFWGYIQEADRWSEAASDDIGL